MRKASFLSLSVSVSLASDLDFVAKYNPYQEPMAARSVSFYILYIQIVGTISYCFPRHQTWARILWYWRVLDINVVWSFLDPRIYVKEVFEVSPWAQMGLHSVITWNEKHGNVNPQIVTVWGSLWEPVHKLFWALWPPRLPRHGIPFLRRSARAAVSLH